MADIKKENVDDGFDTSEPYNMNTFADAGRLEKKLVKTLDRRLMIWAFFGYFANGLDRNNMPNAYTTGLKEDLKMEKNEYNWALVMFFIGYIILQIPANYVITKVRPSIMIPFVVFLWGAVVCFMALVANTQALYGLRFCLGLAEAAFYPGIVFLLGTWYTKEELATRTAIFVAGSQVSGAFSGLISGAISQGLDGAHGMRGWKWLFIIEGLIAVVIGVCGFFLLPDFPHNTRFIQGDMRELAMQRLDRQGKRNTASGLNMTTFRNLFATPYIYLFIGMFICYLSDMFGKRPHHIFAGGLFTLVWYIVLVAVNGGVLPTGLLFVCAYMVPPIFGVSPIMMTWANEIYSCDQETRALAIAMINSIGNLAPNFINVKVWDVSDAPAFRLGKIATMGMTAAMVVMCGIAYFLESKKIMLPKPSQKITDAEASQSKPHTEDTL
ncbi:major facilitator superfamily domain-containing protein [Sporodiniella umbellata]|nr:major facilitator superfamily domain-containing protein [Sporodiniella umbellata]